MRLDFAGNKQQFLHHPIGRKTMKTGFMGKKVSPMLYNNYQVNDVFLKPRDIQEFENVYYHTFF